MSRDHLDALVARLDLEAKVRLLTGANHWEFRGDASIGLRPIVVADGPSGVRGVVWDERDPSVSLPSATAIAASWDGYLVADVARLLAGEARRKGVDVVLGPTVNLHRSPRAGRHFECFSEDPLLTGQLGVAYVDALQAAGIAATPKHYVANDSENERFTLDARVDERTLREVYLAPFAEIVSGAGPWLVMAAYNAVNGARMTEHELLEEPLKGAWGFDGVVVSDWMATTSTQASARSGLDVVMPGPGGPWGDALVAAVRDGEVPEAAVDDHVRRLLLLAERVGALDLRQASDDRGGDDARPDGTPPVPGGLPPAPDAPEVAARVRTIATAGMVLVRNADALLPLAAPELRRVAVIGPNARDARIQGGGSATVLPPYAVSPLDGIRQGVGDGVEVVHAVGASLGGRLDPLTAELTVNPVTGGPGLHVRWLDADGAVVATEDRFQGQIRWLETIPAGATAAEISTRVRADAIGTWQLGVLGLGEVQVDLDGEFAMGGELEADTDAFDAAVHQPPQWAAHRHLDVGDEIAVRVTVAVPDTGFGIAITLGALRPVASRQEMIDQAVAAACDADVAVVVVGTTAQVESEGFDRSSLALPGAQDELVSAVAAANPRTVVVVNAGAPVVMPWRDEVAAILLSWFGGQEYGNALADVLLGVVEPGGRLPTTWPACEEDVPVLETTPTDGVLTYDEGIHVGHRAWQRAGVAPAYPFGFGLGYTTWHLEDLVVSGDPVADEAVTARVTVVNTGGRCGKHVVQAYLSRPESEVERPVLWLAGFAVVRDVLPGARETVELTLERRAFEHWSTAAGDWALEPGGFAVTVGASVADRPLRADLVVGAGGS